MSQYKKSIHKAVKKFIDGYRVARLECVVDGRNPDAVRWAMHLGFVHESNMLAYAPDGSTQLMMVRIEV